MEFAAQSIPQPGKEFSVVHADGCFGEICSEKGGDLIGGASMAAVASGG